MSAYFSKDRSDTSELHISFDSLAIFYGEGPIDFVKPDDSSSIGAYCNTLSERGTIDTLLCLKVRVLRSNYPSIRFFEGSLSGEAELS